MKYYIEIPLVVLGSAGLGLVIGLSIVWVLRSL